RRGNRECLVRLIYDSSRRCDKGERNRIPGRYIKGCLLQNRDRGVEDRHVLDEALELQVIMPDSGRRTSGPNRHRHAGGEQSASRRNRSAGRRHAVHIKRHVAMDFIAHSDEIIPVARRTGGCRGTVKVSGSISNRKSILASEDVQNELFRTAIAFGEDSGAAGLRRKTKNPGVDAENGVVGGWGAEIDSLNIEGVAIRVGK